jgi:hypothetical protein
MSSAVATSMRMRGLPVRASVIREKLAGGSAARLLREAVFSCAPRRPNRAFFQPRSHGVSVRLTRLLLLCLIPGVASVSSAQLPLAPTASSGQSVTPVFEGWYRNPDGTFSISFGYYNRNASEVIEIPIGADNFLTPGDSNQAQPTRFEARRHWGVFAVKVPANFGTSKKVTWTLRMKGETFAIPGSLHPDWEIDALAGEAGTGNTPPVVKLSPDGPSAQGPGGATSRPLEATVGQPLDLTIWATDDGRGAGSVAGGRTNGAQVSLTWFKHQGPGSVTFASPVGTAAADGKATTAATFSVPGTYILRVRANDSSVSGAGHAQCCWTNGFVIVIVK